jgi:hypothetical protein
VPIVEIGLLPGLDHYTVIDYEAEWLVIDAARRDHLTRCRTGTAGTACRASSEPFH